MRLMNPPIFPCFTRTCIIFFFRHGVSVFPDKGIKKSPAPSKIAFFRYAVVNHGKSKPAMPPQAVQLDTGRK
jgi:hypothetical protein